MAKKAKIVELVSLNGEVILKFFVFEREVGERQELPEKEKTLSKEQEESLETDLLMTEAQKRYLFRILAEKGVEKEKAHKHLKELFQVDSLKEVGKLEASRMIERLLQEQKEGEKDESQPPF
jgi:hypothetical protein